MATSVSLERAQKIAAAWDVATSMAHAMKLAGVKSTDSREHRRNKRLTEERLGIQLPCLNPQFVKDNFPRTTHRIDHEDPYTVVVFADGHFWPNETAPPFWILLQIIEELKPRYVIDNGDSLDGATVSRHAKTLFEHLPTLKEEYDCVTHHLGMIKEAAGDATLLRNVGNHDLRFEGKLANQVPEMEGMPGMTTHELFPDWKHNYSVAFNSHLMVKHNWKSGIHAHYSNTVGSGVSFCSAHDHKLVLRPFTDLRGTRYGIGCGTIADMYGPQFAYCQDNPRDWHQGFVVIEMDGEDLYPEGVNVRNGIARFRGKEYKA